MIMARSYEPRKRAGQEEGEGQIVPGLALDLGTWRSLGRSEWAAGLMARMVSCVGSGA